MRLSSLSLRNIRSYESAELTFRDGTTLVAGDVGSGKTSLLYAIEMALFGFVEVDPAYLVRHGAGEGEVALRLSGAGHEYEFRRRFRRRSRRGKEVFEVEATSYSEDGATTPYSVTELRERAISLLGFPDNPNPRAHSDLWRWAVYVPQERMREVLALPADERLETVRKALGLEQYRTAAENAHLLASGIRRLAERDEAEAKGRDHLLEESGRLAEQIESRTLELARLRAVRDERAAELQKAEADLRSRDAEVAGLEAVKTDVEHLVERIGSAGQRISRLDDRLRVARSELAAAEAIVDEAEGLRPRREALLAEVERSRPELERLRAGREGSLALVQELAQVEERRRGLRERFDLASEEADRARAEGRAASAEVERLAHEGLLEEPRPPTALSLRELDAALSAAQKGLQDAVAAEARWRHEVEETEELRAAGVCPRCHQSVNASSFGEHLVELQQALEASRTDRSERARAVATLEGDRRTRERFERDHQRWLDLERSRTNAQGAVDRARGRGEAAGARLVQVRSDVDALESRRRELEPRARAAARDIERLPEAERLREQRESELGRIRQVEEAASAAKTASARHSQEIAGANLERAELTSELDQLQHRVTEARARLSGWDVARAGAEEARRVHDRLRSERQSDDRAVSREEALLDSLKVQSAAARQQLEERRALLEQARRRREMADWVNQPFRETVLAIEHRLLAKAQTEFERNFGRFFSTLVEDPALVARCDVGFAPAVEIDGEWTPPEALSGGERTALALAFRLALGLVVRSAGRLRLETLILDEPTDGFSPEQVERMGELLERLGIPQVIVVSHETGLSSISDQVIQVSKAEGRSSISDGSGALAAPPSSPAVPVVPARRRVRTPRLDDVRPAPPAT